MRERFDEYKISEKAKKQLKEKKNVIKQLSEGKTIQKILGFSDSVMHKFYQKAHYLLEKRRFSDAVNAFTFLVTVDSRSEEYWVGLGMATQMMGDYEMAINAYEMAAVVQVESPIPYLYLSKCLFAVNEKESAMEALNLALEYAEINPFYGEVKSEALEVRRLLLKRLK